MNAYALICPETQESVLIDPGAEPEKLLELLELSQPLAIVLTHTHPDHIGALEEMRRRLNVPVWAYHGPHHGGVQIDEERGLQDGEVLQIGEQRVTVAHTPGHVVDHICLVLQEDDRIIVGECRGPEALDMLQAMNTGHDGSLTTVHSNSPRDAFRFSHAVALRVVDADLRRDRACPWRSYGLEQDPRH